MSPIDLGEWDLATAIIITPPQGAQQILVRVPHPYEKDQVQVDFRQAWRDVWTPHDMPDPETGKPLWPDTVQVNVG